MIGRILAVDPGEKRIGLALSDPLGIRATPLKIVPHVSRTVDAAQVAQLAAENDAVRIIVGQPLDAELGGDTPQGRRAARFADAIREQSEIPVELWDESMSTQDARSIRMQMGVSRNKRQGHLDDVAAAVILQSYLDAHAKPAEKFEE